MFKAINNIEILVVLILLSFLFLVNNTSENDYITTFTPIKFNTVTNNLEHPQKLFKEKYIECLAKNVYHEARGEDILGKAMVVKVVLNRMAISNYTKDPCDIVYQPSQFSWTKDNSKELTNDELYEYKDFVKTVLDNEVMIPDTFSNVTHYYNDSKIHKPKWAFKLHRVGKIGNHVFFAEN